MTEYLTPEGLEKLKKELYHLKNVERREISKKIKKAASFGDLKENAAYHEAKEAQGFLEGKILELKSSIVRAEVVEKKENGKIQIGSIVILDSDEEKEEYQIVGSEEVDVLKGKISYKSPLGKALLGKKKGEEVKIKSPEGEAEYLISDIH